MCSGPEERTDIAQSRNREKASVSNTYQNRSLKIHIHSIQVELYKPVWYAERSHSHVHTLVSETLEYGKRDFADVMKFTDLMREMSLDYPDVPYLIT